LLQTSIPALPAPRCGVLFRLELCRGGSRKNESSKHHHNNNNNNHTSNNNNHPDPAALPRPAAPPTCRPPDEHPALFTSRTTMPGPLPKSDPKMLRDAIELVYNAENAGSDRRTVANRIHTKLGIGAKFLLAKANALPEGLANNDTTMSLRRAANHATGLDKVTAVGEKDTRCYTNTELCIAVVTEHAKLASAVHLQRKYCIPKTSFQRARTAYYAWLKDKLKDNPRPCPRPCPHRNRSAAAPVDARQVKGRSASCTTTVIYLPVSVRHHLTIYQSAAAKQPPHVVSPLSAWEPRNTPELASSTAAPEPFTRGHLTTVSYHPSKRRSPSISATAARMARPCPLLYPRRAHRSESSWSRAAELCCRNVFASWRSWEICLRSLTSSLSISCCSCSSACLACSSCCCAARSSSDAERSAAPPVPPPASAGRPAGRAARSSATGQGWAGHRRCRSSWLHGPGGV